MELSPYTDGTTWLPFVLLFVSGYLLSCYRENRTNPAMDFVSRFFFVGITIFFAGFSVIYSLRLGNEHGFFSLLVRFGNHAQPHWMLVLVAGAGIVVFDAVSFAVGYCAAWMLARIGGCYDRWYTTIVAR